MRIHDLNSVRAKAGRDRRAATFLRIFEIQITNHSRRMDNRYGQARVLGCWIKGRQRVATGVEEFMPANRRETSREAIHAVTDARSATIRPGHVAREMRVDSMA